ncbi:MFS transporter [Streptomonospora wellingtoniae]|uniref:MFS transporter n=1 Tax=Streptomonospora wellingtoniae TaxID=3075544 RepID=A0ABU2KUU1_9ACTN|nr:MFS transporter [Streptomonospora sp. DSM 45055]MDT0303059.1 MFS transporter [Streptomonospora sp. DSM 45055]
MSNRRRSRRPPRPGAAPADRGAPGGRVGGAAGLGRDFRRFWGGALSSNLADGTMLTALPMAAATLTDDPLQVSGLAIARFLPWLLFGLLAGVVVDRADRVRLMAAANTVRCCALALLAVLVATGQATVWGLYAVMFAAMLCEVFYDLSGRAALPDVVPAGTLDRANGRLEGGKLVAEQFAGASVAGLLFAVAAALPLALNAGAYLVGALVLLGLPAAVRRPAGPGRAARAGAGGGLRSVAADLGVGLGAVFGRRGLRTVALLLALVNAAMMAQSAVLVLLVQDHFGVPEALYGLFLSSAAAGGVLGAASADGLVRRLGRFATCALAFAALGALSASFALSPGAVTGGLAWCALAFAAAVVNVVTAGIWQLVVPGALLGRALSCIRTAGASAAPLGAALGGLLGRVDLRLPSLAAGSAIVLGTALAAPALRLLSRSADAAEREATAALDGLPPGG